MEKTNLTRQELDKLLEGLPNYWNKVGEKKMVENIYRYLMTHNECLECEAGQKVFEYASRRIVKIWCKSTNTTDEVWMKKYIDLIFKGQIDRTPELAERGKIETERLIRQFRDYPKIVDYYFEKLSTP